MEYTNIQSSCYCVVDLLLLMFDVFIPTNARPLFFRESGLYQYT